MKVVTVIGARPQFIKAAPVSAALAAGGVIDEVVVHTGQHYDDNMSRVFFDELGMREPALHLGVGGGSHGAMTGRMLEAIEGVLLADLPDWVLVYGDTNSTLAGALAAAKLHVPVAHVEAGLRSFNRRMPEELNRVLTDHLAELLFAPTETAVDNLSAEGIAGPAVQLVGDVMYDVALQTLAKGEGVDRLGRFGLLPGGYVLATIHRAENTDNPAVLASIFLGLSAVAERHQVVVPLHPRTEAALRASGLLDEAGRRLRLLPPVGYLDMVALERGALLIATDSGGVQKEAYFHRVPCVTLREETEWVELVEHGWNRLVSPTNADEVAAAILGSIGSQGREIQLYGGGKAAHTIARILAAAD